MALEEPSERLGRQRVSHSPSRDFSPIVGEKSRLRFCKGSNLLAFTKMPASQSDAAHHGYFLQSCTLYLAFEARSGM